MDTFLKRIASLIWMFLCYFVFTLINIGTDIALSHNLIEKSKDKDPNHNETTSGIDTLNLKSTTFMFGCVVLFPAVLSFFFNVMKWFVFEDSTTSCGSHSIPTKVFSWIISPFYSIYLVLKILVKAIRGTTSWEEDKRNLEGEVGYHESGVQSMLQVTFLGVVVFNALYTWVLRILEIETVKTDVT